MASKPFHLAFPVLDIEKTRHFYTEILNCSVGREAEHWIDFNFFGHQISAHLVQEVPLDVTNSVDGDAVPSRHFGIVLEWDEWHQFSEKLKKQQILFLIPPHIRFVGQVGEQATLFIQDPSGNCLEFKAFRDICKMFARS